MGGGTEAERDLVTGFVPRLAVSAGGSAFVCWHRQTASASTVWISHYDPAGGWQQAEQEGSGDDPGLGIDESGNALLVWTRRDSAPPELWWRRFAGGAGWTAAARVPAQTDGRLDFALAVAPAGTALLVCASAAGVAALDFSPAEGWQAAVPIGADVTGDGVSSPQVVVDGRGDAAVVWIQRQNTVPHGHAWLRGTQRVTGSGWRAAQDVGEGGWSVSSTRLRGDRFGNALVAWSGFLAVPVGLKSNRLSPATGWQGPQAIDLPSLFPGQLGMGSEGTAVLILRPTSSESASRLSALQLRPAPSSWSAPVSLALGTGHAIRSVDLDVRGAGEALVVWDQVEATNGGSTVWGTPLSQDVRWGTPRSLGPEEAPLGSCGDGGVSGASSPVVGFDSGGRALAVWAEWDCARWSVWARRFDPQGLAARTLGRAAP